MVMVVFMYDTVSRCSNAVWSGIHDIDAPFLSADALRSSWTATIFAEDRIYKVLALEGAQVPGHDRFRRLT